MYRSGKRKSPSSYSNKPFKKPRQIVPSARPRYYRVAGRSAGALVTVAEKKYFDSTRAVSTLATGWADSEFDPTTLNCLFAPQQGTAINQRVGRKVQVQKIKIRGLLSYSAVATASAIQQFPACRVIVYQDQQTNGVQSQGEQVIATTGSTNEQVICNYQNLDNFGRFRVLKDKTFVLRDAVANTTTTDQVSQDFAPVPFKFSLNFKKPITVHFNAANGGSVADITDNFFHVIAMSTDTCTITYQARVVFVDA